MAQQCERPACAEPATVGYGFDRERGMVWLVPLSEEGADHGRLCRRHADSMGVPRGWWLDDRRADAQLFVPPERSGTRRRRRVRRGVDPAQPSLLTTMSEAGAGGPAVRSTPPDARTGGHGAPASPRAPLELVAAEVDPGVAAVPQAPGTARPAPAAVLDVGRAPNGGPDDDETGAPPLWMPAFVAGDDLDGVLNATSPLLARAFGQVKGSGTRPRPPA